MSGKAAGKAESASATGSKTVERSEDSGSVTINPDQELYNLCIDSYAFAKDHNKFNKKQTRLLEQKANKFFNIINKKKKPKLDDSVTLAQVYFNMCEPFTELEGKENQRMVAEKIEKCVTLLKNKELHCKTILLALYVYNISGRTALLEKKTQRATHILDNAIKLYLTYVKRKEEYGVPLYLETIFCQPSITTDSFVQLKGIYGYFLQNMIDLNKDKEFLNKERLILYKHNLLDVQFDTLLETKKGVIWITHATELIDHFLVHRRFREAKSLLTVAFFVKNYYVQDVVNVSETQISEKGPEWKSRRSIVIKLEVLWAKYAIEILRTLTVLPPEESENTKADPDSETLLLLTNIEERYGMATLDVPVMTDSISTRAGAQDTFSVIVKLLYEAKVWYFLRELLNCADKYLSVQLNINKAFNYRARYEQDTNKLFVLNQQRLKVLEEAAKQVQNKIDGDKRQYLRLQQAIAYASMAEVKFDQLLSVDISYLKDDYYIVKKEMLTFMTQCTNSIKMYINYK